MLLVILRKYVAVSGLRRFCWIIGHNSIKNPAYIKQRKNSTWDISKLCIFGLHRLYIAILKKKKVFELAWPEVLVEPCFVFFCSNCWLGLLNFTIFSWNYKKFCLCKQNLFSFENIQRKISPFQKVYIHKVFGNVRLTYSHLSLFYSIERVK